MSEFTFAINSYSVMDYSSTLYLETVTSVRAMYIDLESASKLNGCTARRVWRTKDYTGLSLD